MKQSNPIGIGKSKEQKKEQNSAPTISSELLSQRVPHHTFSLDKFFENRKPEVFSATRDKKKKTSPSSFVPTQPGGGLFDMEGDFKPFEKEIKKVDVRIKTQPEQDDTPRVNM